MDKPFQTVNRRPSGRTRRPISATTTPRMTTWQPSATSPANGATG
jgi:hypothetical protein